MRRLSGIVLALLSAGIAGAIAAPPATQAELEIRAMEQLRTEARVKANVATLDRIVAHDAAAQVRATRFAQNPLITVDSSPSIGDNVNGPAIIHVPSWI